MDSVSLGNGLNIRQQSIGVATRSQGFGGVDGILGFVVLYDLKGIHSE